MTKGNEIEKIKQLYQLYGFTLAPNSDPEQYLIFSFIALQKNTAHS